MICNFGRTYNPDHRTCISCEKKGIKTCKTKKKVVRRNLNIVTPKTEGDRKTLICQLDLPSVNKWHNKKNGDRIYRKERDKWVNIFCFHGKRFWGKHQKKRRKLTVVRHVPDKRYLIRDITNREGAFKPLEDALTISEIIVDDAETWLERPPLQQTINPALGQVVTEISIEDL